MNDLERDLKELFESKAGDVQTTPLAPKAVLRRGRRRQVGTVVGGAVMAVVAAALVIGGASAFLDDRADAPPMGDPDALPARTATIGGVTVTAPEGWSLMDQWPLGMNIGTETCTATFEGSGTPVGEGAGGGSDEPVGTPAADECTPVDLPGGVPLFTLGNVEPNPAQAVCEIVPEIPGQAVGPTDAFLYVALDPNAEGGSPAWPQAFGEAFDGGCGNASVVRWSVDGVSYLAAAAFGADASDEDRDALMAAFEGLGFHGMPQAAGVAPVMGFVVAAGVEDGTAWRLEAGPNLACEGGGTCSVEFVLITTDAQGVERSLGTLPPATEEMAFNSTSQPVGGTTIAFGTAASNVTEIEVVAEDGTEVTPTSTAWPRSLRSFGLPEPSLDGTIWWASVPDAASVNATLTDGTTLSGGTGAASPAPPVSAGGRAEHR